MKKSKFSLCLMEISLFFVMFFNVADAKTVFKVPNETPYLTISNKQQMEVSAFGPSDFVVLENLIAILDSDGNRISFFDKSGKYTKQIKLPNGFYQRLIKDRNNTLYAFANNGLYTSIVKINEQGIEQKEIEGSLDNIIAHALVDDYGLFFEKINLINPHLIDQIHKEKKISPTLLNEIKKESNLHGQLIKRDCFSCNPVNTREPKINGLTYQIKYQNDKGEKPSLFIGDKKIELNHKYRNAGTRIEQIDQDGAAWIEQSIFMNQQTVDTYIIKILPSGEIESIYRLPKIHPDDYVLHQISISDKGELWFMQGQPSGLLFNIIKPLSKEATIDFINLKNNLLIKNSPAIKDDFKKNNVISSFHENESCQSRTMMFIRGIRYLYFYHCYPLEAIENDISCPGRMVPFFLDGGQTQCLFSVSYNWGGFDSVETYSEKIERMKAGNVNTGSFPLLNCTTGVDCSGFISNLWGLKTKWGTSQIFANTPSVDISQMKVGDVFVKTNSHVIMYTGNLNDNISTMESVVRPGKVISSEHPIKWFIQHGYTPKLAYNACEDDYS